jgi:tRNA(fMet)-specific endonuclease VapC
MAILDTTFLIDWMKEAKRHRSARATLKLTEFVDRGEDLRVTVFTVGELYIGVAKGNQPLRETRVIETALAAFEVVGFDVSTARIFGMVVGRLETLGLVISEIDALIASIALEQEELLVTRNERHFVRVPGLRVEVC